MEFNKCSRCGNFYVSSGAVCPKCSTKDGFELSTFKSYLQENGFGESLDTISGQTGISVRNLNRFMGYEEIKEYQSQYQNNSKTGNNGNIGVTFN